MDFVDLHRKKVQTFETSRKKTLSLLSTLNRSVRTIDDHPDKDSVIDCWNFLEDHINACFNAIEDLYSKNPFEKEFQAAMLVNLMRASDRDKDALLKEVFDRMDEKERRELIHYLEEKEHQCKKSPSGEHEYRYGPDHFEMSCCKHCGQ